MTVTANSFHAAISVALRDATRFPLSWQLVEDNAISVVAQEPDGPHSLVDAQFLRAARDGLASLPRGDRLGGLNLATGAAAEAIAACLLADSGWVIVQQQTTASSGGHGIDLAALSPEMEHLFVIEVKGTLMPRRWPRLTRGETDQLGAAWLDKHDQPGMADLGVESKDVYGLAVLIQLGQRKWKAAATRDFASADPILSLEQLDDIDWLVSA